MQSFSRYFPSDPAAAGWGWRILDAGRQQIEPGASYPGEGHPQGYLFDASGRRTLDEFQIVCIDAAIVRRAKAAMLRQLEERTDLEALARELGCSYSRFRFAFGKSPKEWVKADGLTVER